MKNYFEAVILAGRESNNEGFINWLIMKLDHEQIDILQRAAVIYAEQSNSHKPVVVRGGDKDDNLSTIERTMLTTPIVKETPNTPTEPLPAEGLAQNGREGFYCISGKCEKQCLYCQQSDNF